MKITVLMAQEKPNNVPIIQSQRAFEDKLDLNLFSDGDKLNW